MKHTESIVDPMEGEVTRTPSTKVPNCIVYKEEDLCLL
jgi:hypothetical protein